MLQSSASIHSAVYDDDHNNNHNTYHSSSSDDEEQEQERLLSEKYGEANETSAPRSKSNNKRSNPNPYSYEQTDAEIADALNKAKTSTSSTEDEIIKQKKKARMTFTEAKLTGTNGLVYIRNEFPSKLKYPSMSIYNSISKPKNSKDVNVLKTSKRQLQNYKIQASAKYLSSLMSSYQNVCHELAPNLHYKDALIKIEKLGSKKQVRSYLNVMREEICKERLKKIYGDDRADKLVQELEEELQAHQERLLSDQQQEKEQEGGQVDEVGLQTVDNESNSVSANSNNLSTGRGGGGGGENNNESDNVSLDDNSRKEKEKQNNDNHNNQDDDDDDDEAEASFDDVIGSSKVIQGSEETESSTVDASLEDEMDNPEEKNDDQHSMSNANKANEDDDDCLSSSEENHPSLDNSTASEHISEKDSEMESELDSSNNNSMQDESNCNEDKIQNQAENDPNIDMEGELEDHDCNERELKPVESNDDHEETQNQMITQNKVDTLIEEETETYVNSICEINDTSTSSSQMDFESSKVGYKEQEQEASISMSLAQTQGTQGEEEEDEEKRIILDSSQNFDETQTIIPSMTPTGTQESQIMGELMTQDY